MPDSDLTVQGSGAFRDCRWCLGRGCLYCQEEYEKEAVRRSKPIFTASIDDPKDMAALRRVIGSEALQRAFGPGGGGIEEVEYNAAVESVVQILRKSKKEET